MKSYASAITAKFTLKRFFMVINPFLCLVGGAEKGFKPLFTFAAFVEEKNMNETQSFREKVKRKNISDCDGTAPEVRSYREKAKKYFRL